LPNGLQSAGRADNVLDQQLSDCRSAVSGASNSASIAATTAACATTASSIDNKAHKLSSTSYGMYSRDSFVIL
jgi:hypothetical protein